MEERSRLWVEKKRRQVAEEKRMKIMKIIEKKEARKEKQTKKQFLRKRKPVKKSRRHKPKEETEIEKKLRLKSQDGLVISDAGKKGRGVFTTKSFSPGDFLCEYTGELLIKKEGEKREELYNKNPLKYGSFVFYFVDDACRDMCIDSTNPVPEVPEPVGRLVNHITVGGNVMPKPVCIHGVTRLVFFASRSIKKGQELLYNYNDRRKSVIEGGNEFLVEAPAEAGTSE